MTDIKNLYPNAKMNTKDVEILSKAHADWICKILNFVMTDFGVHMYGHGFKDASDNTKKELYVDQSICNIDADDYIRK